MITGDIGNEISCADLIPADDRTGTAVSYTHLLMNELGKINKILESEYPDAYRETLVVLDATTGELDSNRKTYLLESIKDTQTIITCTALDEFISKHLPIQRMLQIKEGKIVKEN